MNKYLFYLLTLILLASCATKKQVFYFQDLDTLDQQQLPEAFEPVIERNDILYITVSSLNPELVLPFKRDMGQQNMNMQQNLGLIGYLVNAEGKISFPVLGDLLVEGMTREGVKALLKEKLGSFITDVVVDVRILNFQVAVMGEVKSPGWYTIPNERISLPQALALAGDLTLDARRDGVVVVREQDGKRQVAHIDLTATDLFSSPYFFLKQNDLVYVQPNTRGIKKSGLIGNVPVLLSLFTVILSSVVLITR